MGVVTISASYGSGGSEIGPAVSSALGLPFVDRAIPRAVAEALGIPVHEAEEQDDRAHRGLWRLLTSMALVPDLSGGGLAYSTVSDERLFKERTEQVLGEVADGPGGVILGRAAAVVLADRTDALHVRLDGPLGRRAEHVAETQSLSRTDAVRLIEENDGAREAYVRTFYRRDARDCGLYHVVLDATALSSDVIIEVIVRGARSLGIGR